MKEYVEREAVLKFIENGLNNPNKLKAFGHDAVEIMAEIQYMPAANVAPVVHGKWEWNEYGQMGCSVCNAYPELAIEKPYCPNCGAHMKDGDG